jgi:tetratricopeptide (TPR) repeat protein
MIDREQPENYYSNISKIVNVIKRTSGSGILFCVCNDPQVIHEVNHQVIQRCRDSKLNVHELSITRSKADRLTDTFRKAAEPSPKAIMVNNLDSRIQDSGGAIISDLNFAREFLIDLEVCFIFWLSEKNMALFANKATDLYIRRDRSVVRFPESFKQKELELAIPFEKIEGINLKKLKQLNLKIQLLEKQLKEAAQKQYSKKRIAVEIIFDLVTACLEADDIGKAAAYFSTYKSFFENSDRLDYLKLTATIYFTTREFDIAENCYQRIEGIQRETGNLAGQASTFHQLGGIAQERRDFETAETWFQKALMIKKKQGNEHGAAMAYHQLGRIAQERRDFEAAETWFQKARKIFEKLCNEHGTSITYHQLGRIAQERRDFETAETWYQKALMIKEKQGDEHGIALTNMVLGFLFSAEKKYVESGKRIIKAIIALKNSNDDYRLNSAIQYFLALYNQQPPPIQEELRKEWKQAGLGNFPSEKKESP